MRKNTEAVADRLGILPKYRDAFLNMSMDDESHTYIVPGFMDRAKKEPYDYILWESVTTKINHVYNKDYKKKNIEDTVGSYRESIEKYGPTTTSNGNEYYVVPVGDIDGIDETAMGAVQKNLDWYGPRGTAIHTAIEEHDTAGEYGSYVQAVDTWFDSHDHVGELWGHEVMIYHPKAKYAGTIDGVGVGPDGGLVIWDYKSGAKSPDHLIQLGGYASALKELTDREVTRAFVCYLTEYIPKKSEYPYLLIGKKDNKRRAYLGGPGSVEPKLAGMRPDLVSNLYDKGKAVDVWSWVLGLDDWKRSKPWE